MNGIRVLKFGIRITAPAVSNDEDDGAFLMGRHANSFLLHNVYEPCFKRGIFYFYDALSTTRL
jgi:hypothetical protein